MSSLLLPLLLGCHDEATHRRDTAATPEPLPQFDGPIPKNILMISVDTMRRDHIGRRDAPSLTPFLDARMAESLVVEDAMACSNWTVATTACVLSGADSLDRAADRGMIPIVSSGVLAPIPSPEPMLPHWLSESAGFRTMLVTTNGYFSGAYGNAQGYQVLLYDGPARVTDTWERTRRVIDPALGGRPMPSPWLLHLHFFEPHRPYTPPDDYLAELADLPEIPFDLDTVEGQDRAVTAVFQGSLDESVAEAVRQHMRVRYAGEIRFFDDQIARMWADLDRLGLLDDTLVVFWSDHGEGLWEHDTTEHGRLLYAQENDAILWLWSRDIVPGTLSGPVHQIDLAPTLLSLYGVPIPETVTGIPLGLAPPDRVRTALADAYFGPVLAVRQRDLKMQFRWEGQPIGVFDLAEDPGEQNNLFDPTDARTRDLWAQLAPHIEAAVPYIAQDPRDYTLAWPPDLPAP